MAYKRVAYQMVVIAVLLSATIFITGCEIDSTNPIDSNLPDGFIIGATQDTGDTPPTVWISKSTLDDSETTFFVVLSKPTMKGMVVVVRYSNGDRELIAIMPEEETSEAFDFVDSSGDSIDTVELRNISEIAEMFIISPELITKTNPDYEGSTPVTITRDYNANYNRYVVREDKREVIR